MPVDYCKQGTGQAPYLALCQYACFYGYCPPPCTCTWVSTPIPAGNLNGKRGIGLPQYRDLPGFNGLCDFGCAREFGYCPPEYCTETTYT
jgi:hypothetical protein